MSTVADGEWVDFAGVLARVPFGRRSVERYVRSGQLTAYRLTPGGKRFFRTTDVDALVNLDGNAPHYGPTDRWFRTLMAAAAKAADRPPLTREEVDGLTAALRVSAERNYAIAPYRDDAAYLSDSVFALLDHWREGTVSAVELASVYNFMREYVDAHADAVYVAHDTPEEADARVEHRADLFDVLERMAVEVLREP